MGKCKLFCVFLKVAPKCLGHGLGGHILKLSDKVTMTRAFPAHKLFGAVIVFFHRVSPIQFFKKIHAFFFKKQGTVLLFFLKISFMLYSEIRGKRHSATIHSVAFENFR